MAAVEKKPSPRQQRHRQTASDFERWLAKNPEASLKRRVGAFNAIADSNFKSLKNRHTQRKPSRVK